MQTGKSGTDRWNAQLNAEKLEFWEWAWKEEYRLLWQGAANSVLEQQNRQS